MELEDRFGTTEVSVLVLAFTFCLHFCDIFITTTIRRNLQLATCNWDCSRPSGKTVGCGEEICEAVGFGEADNVDMDV